jgi:hypothetical protein
MRTCKYEPKNDNYWGSSQPLTEDIGKLGINQFKKRILKTWNTRSQASKHERSILKKYGSEKTFYNIRGYLSDARQAEIAVEKEQLTELKLEKEQLTELKLEKEQLIKDIKKLEKEQLTELKLEKEQLIKDIKKLEKVSLGRKPEGQKERTICSCGERPVAINYKKDGITHYRAVCSTCSKKRKTSSKNKNFKGYIKKQICEKCGFKATYPEQLDVYVINNNPLMVMNLKTVCLNCETELQHTKNWPQGDLIADY